MKNIYYVLLMNLLAVAAFSQQYSMQMSLSKNNACPGDSITATLRGPEIELSSDNFGTGLNHPGLMFNLAGKRNATITGFKLGPVSNGTDFEVYYKVGSYVGYENTPSAWTLLDSSSNISAGANIDIGVDLYVPINAGDTLGFYITSKTPGNNIYCAANSSSGYSTLASDRYLWISEGVGNAYPFGNITSPRCIIGKVIYEPEIDDIWWNISNDTTRSTTFVAQRSVVVSAQASYYNYYTYDLLDYELLSFTDHTVNVYAVPDTIQYGQSSTLNATVISSTGLATSANKENSQNGAMMDIVAHSNAEINGFSVFTFNDSADFEIFYKTGSHVGYEDSAAAWTSLGTYIDMNGKASIYLPLSPPLSISSGQMMSFYITRTDGGNVYYSNGTGMSTVAVSDSTLQINKGKGVMYPFGQTFSPRILNCIVHYKTENPPGTVYSWFPNGGSLASTNVNPGSTTTYTLTVDTNGCSVSDTVTVFVNGGFNLEDEMLVGLKVYPNPANDHITVSWDKAARVSEITMTDLSGNLLITRKLDSPQENTNITVNNFAKGLYILRVKLLDGSVSCKVLLE